MKQTEQWTSKLGFIMAAAGSAIDLAQYGSFLISPGRAGRSILLIFILFTILIGLPLLIAEFMIDVVRRNKQLAHLKVLHQIQGGTGLTPWCWNVFYTTFIL